MNRQVLSALVMGVLLLFILSPFSALALLMLMLAIATGFWLINSLVQGLTSEQGKEN